MAYFYQVAAGAGYGMTFEFNIEKFCHNFKHFPIQADAALKILNRAGYIEYTDEQDNKARVMFTVSRDTLYRLENNSENEDKVIVTLLRNYGGLFSDYNFIDESLIAMQTGLKSHEVYLTLKLLAAKHIIKFIPRKKTPYIRYTQRRENTEHLMFPKEVYEERKRQFTERINAMIEYAATDDTCRSRMLLEYFGEHTDHDCDSCDVCMEHRKENNHGDATTETQAEIMAILSDMKPHPITELNTIKRPYEQIDTAQTYLINEEKIYRMDGMIFIGN